MYQQFCQYKLGLVLKATDKNVHFLNVFKITQNYMYNQCQEIVCCNNTDIPSSTDLIIFGSKNFYNLVAHKMMAINLR